MAQQRFFCLRFDIDTDLCLREGLPALLELGHRQAVPFTFFVSPGRAVDLTLSLKRGLFRRQDVSVEGARRRLKTLDKLPASEVARLVLQNPSHLPRHAAVVRSASEAGHEIGLHGGTNHGTWQTRAHEWSVNELHEEVAFGVERLKDATGRAPEAFASPGWNSPPALPQVLAQVGFKKLADTHGPDQAAEPQANGTLIEMPTRLSGEPGGVGYLEWCRAMGDTSNEILSRVTDAIASPEPFVCLYDHPFYAGIKELPLLDSILSLAKSNGRTVCTMSEATDRIIAASASTP